MNYSVTLLLLLISLPLLAPAAPTAVSNLLQRLESENHEIKVAKLKKMFSEQSLRGSKSKLWPSLSLTLGHTESEDGALGSGTSNFDTGTSSPSGSLGQNTSASSTNLDNLNSNQAYSAQASVGYYLFSQFAVSQDIKRAKWGVKASELNEQQTKEAKKAQLLQLLLEYQFLSAVEPQLAKAEQLTGKMKSHRQKKSDFLFSTTDRIDSSQKQALLEYEIVRIREGKSLVFSAIQAMLPEIKKQELNSLEKFQIKYQVPAAEVIESKFRNQSRSYKISSLDIDSAKAYNHAAEWSKPWIPIVYLSASYSKSGDYEDAESNGTSASLLFNFNIFDGFYTSAKIQQSRVSVKLAEEKQNLESTSKVLYLKHQRMKALVAKADYKVKVAKSRKKEQRYKDVQRKSKQGIATRLEISGSALDLVKAKFEALSALKEYQQAVTDIAIELNEWNKVVISEVN